MTIYKNPTPVVVCVVTSNDGLIGVQRAIEPFIGKWAFPGGYVDENETAEEAACREFFEETGFEIESELWEPFRTLITPDNKLLIFMDAFEVISADRLELFVPNGEVMALKVLTGGDELCFPLHTKVLQEYCQEYF